MKYAIFFAFVALAFLAQANAKSVDSVDRGAIANALKAKLAAAKEKLSKLLDKASDQLKEKINEIRKKAEQLIDQLKVEVNKISDSVFEAAQKVINEAGEIEDKIAKFFPNFESIKAIEDNKVKSAESQ